MELTIIFLKIWLLCTVVLLVCIRSLIDYLLVIDDLTKLKVILELNDINEIKLITIRKTYLHLHDELIKIRQIKVTMPEYSYYYYLIIRSYYVIKKFNEHPTIKLTSFLFPFIYYFIPLNILKRHTEILFVIFNILTIYLYCFAPAFFILAFYIF